jgi:hypothetical protein
VTVTLTPGEQALAAAFAADDRPAIDRLTAELDAAHAAREARLDRPSALGDAALWYAEQGIAVFPCRPGGKAPATKNGFKDATTDLDQVRAWWAATPDANIGLPTGRRFDVIDVDGPEGTIALGDYKDAGGMPPVLAWARTPHGFHYLIAPTGAGNRAGMLTGVDYRGAGGYVVAPPSRTADGTYRWVPGHELNPSLLPGEAA